jgi:hypothetical protein
MPRNADVMAVCDAAEKGLTVTGNTVTKKGVTGKAVTKSQAVTGNRRGRPATGKAMTQAERARRYREGKRGE